MAIKPFAIQGADLTLGGVNLQAGATTIVIPGVTQAVDYFVEEVDERDGNNPSTFGSNAGAITVIDNAEYLYLVDDGDTPSQSYVAATYSVDELDDGEIEEINVESAGVFLSADKTRAETSNMWATLTPTPFVSFNTANWTQIPFRPKMRAGAVENVGGGGNANTGNFTFNADTIANNNDASIEVVGGSLGNIEVNAVDELVPPGGIWRLFISDEEYPTLGTTVQIGDTVTTSWGTPITATITDIVQDSGDWQIHVDQDITAGHDDYDTVTFSTVVTTKTWTFGQDGSLTLPNGMSIDSYGTLGVNAVVSIGGDDTRITIDNNGAPPGLTITTNATAGMGQRQWRFGPDGDLTFPDGTTQTTAYTSSGAIGTFFVVANDSGEVSKSTDGVTWTAGVDTGDDISRVATDGVTVAMLQSDQLSWTTFAGLEASTYVSGSSSISDKIGDRSISWNQIDYAGGYFVAVGRYTPTGSTLSQGVYGYSTDGRSWAFLTVDQTVVEYFGNDPVDSDWEFSDIDYNGVGWMFSVSDDEGTGTPQGGGVYITDLTATITSARCFSMSITYDAAWNGSAWYMEGNNSLAGVNISLDPRNGTWDGPIDPWDTDIQDLGIDAGDTVELAGGNGYIAASDSDGHVAWSDDNGVTWQIVTPIPYTRSISEITQASPAVVTGSGENGNTGEKVIISGSSVAGYNGTFYWDAVGNSLYTDQARTTPFDTSGLEPFTGTATLTWSHGMYIDAMDYINGYFYIGNDNEQIARTVDFVSWTIVDDQTNDFEFWNDIAGFVNTGGDIGDIVVTVDEENTTLSLANKDFTLETTRTGTQDADINIFAADDIFIEANGDDIALSAKDQVRINTGDSNGDPEDYKTWRFNSDGRIQFPDGKFQTTAYPSSDVWVQEFKTSLGSQVDAPVMASSVEYLAGGDIVALFIHSENILGDSYSGVARINSAGERVWSMKFTGAPGTNGWGLAVDNNGGYIYVAGTASGLSDGLGGTLTYDVATLTKLSQTDGDVVWSCAYDVGVANTNTVVDVASDGSPVVVGYVQSEEDDQVVTSKINAVDGSVTWSRAIDGQGDEQAYGMAVGPTGEIVTVGWMTQLGVTDAVATLYTDPVSNPNWVTTAAVTGGSGANYTVSFTGGVPTFTNINDPVGNRTVDGILDTIPGASFGGVTGVDDMIVKVGTVLYEPDNRMLIVKYNSAGAIQWQKAVQVEVGYDCSGADADIDSEGNIYVCGNFEYDASGIRQSVIIIKFNSLGVKQWTRQITGDCGDFATSIVVGPDNFLYLSAVTVNATNTDVNMVIAKYDIGGSVEWQRLLSNTTNAVFAGEFFLNSEGGSNLAVKNGYVAVGGGFGDIANFPYSLPNAIVAQVGSHGAEFLAGNFEFEVAGFSGNLDDTASNITVVNAGKTDTDYAGEFTVNPFDPIVDLTSDLIGTLYHGSGGENRLFNSGRSLVLETTGAVTLPKGGTITEGVVTSNPTIQLTPARPDVASQKLVIKGGGAPNTYILNNNIQLEWSATTAIVGATVNFNIVDSTTYANQTLYWWIYPTDVGIGDSDFGTVAIDNNGDGTFSIEIDSDDYEFTVRVSPENNNYDPDNLGVESYLINASAPTYEDYHLHLTTGDLTETSIFLGTDNHNVRTNTDGTIQVTTTYYGAVDSVAFINSSGGYITGTYTGLGTTGGTGEGLTVDATSTGGIIDVITVVNPGKGYTDDDVITLVGGDEGALGCTFVVNVPTGISEWQFGNDGSITFPDTTVQTTAWTGARTTVSAGTASLANAATGNLTITGYKGYALYKIQTSAAAWVRIYTDTASRSADSGRSELTDPTPGSGVIAEVITTGAETVLISPGAMGFSNESTPSTNIELAVTNKSGGTTAITVTLTVLQLEA